MVSKIDWSKGPYFLKTETDPTGGIKYDLITTSQLLSVPYALYAGNALPSGGADGQVLTICDPETGDIIGINKSSWRIYDYNFNFILFEERINVVTFVGGNGGLMYAT